jgi:ABC-2 type transport system ATP-binding protein
VTDIVAELAQARKSYGAVEAVRGVDLTIRRGEAVALLGPNGAGKTTAIGLLLGLRRPTAGTARLFGLPPTDRRARSRCGVVLQESGVAAVLTVRETVDLFRAYYPAPMSAEAAIGFAGLEDKADGRVGELSGGQRQRLYFALAVCGDPEVLFLDEPTVGMDVAARQLFLDALRGFIKAGKTIVLTTHYLEEADQLAGRVVVIDRGVVVADGSPAAIKARVPGRRISFRTPDGPETFLTNEPEAALRALFARGVEVRDLEVVGATLEEALRTLERS